MNSGQEDILDEPESMDKIDKSNMLRVIENLPEQVKDAMELKPMELERLSPAMVAVLGMGGSAICGDIISSWLSPTVDIPIVVVRNYNLPKMIKSDSLVIAVSFSGNTEETLSAFEEAVERSARVVALSTGGKLKVRANELGVPHIKINPLEKLVPRAAIAYLLFPVISIMTTTGILSRDDIQSELDDVVEILGKLRERLHPGVESINNEAKQVAASLKDRYPLVYSYQPFTPIAYRWVTQLNENSKILAKAHELPEMNHNDIVGLNGDDNSTKHTAVLLRNPATESDRMRKRIELTRDLAFSRTAELIEIKSEGNYILSQMLSLMYLGDYTSVYLALLRGVDPTPVDVIENLKDLMSR